MFFLLSYVQFICWFYLLMCMYMFGLGPDGSVYIGDYNLLRRLYPDGRLATVLQFKSKQVNNCTAI